MIKYKVFEGVSKEIVKDGVVTATVKQFFWHTILGNNEIVAPSQGYNVKADAFDTIESIWYETAKAQGHAVIDQAECSPSERLTRLRNFVHRYPVPYTHDSLQRKHEA